MISADDVMEARKRLAVALQDAQEKGSMNMRLVEERGRRTCRACGLAFEVISVEVILSGGHDCEPEGAR